VINDILDYSKVEAGRLSLDPIPFDLERAVHDVARLLIPSAEEKGLEMVVAYDPDCPRQLVGDSGRIRQVLLNLMGNAVKFTEQGYVKLEVRAEKRIEDQHVLIFARIDDTGIGIPDEAQGRLFNSFMQADSSTTRKYGGTGLGLAISKRLIELMGGEIGVVSKPGKGSTFWFRIALPVADAQVQLPRAQLAGKRVLIVDDLPVNQHILEGLLGHEAMACASASSGLEALQRLEAAVAQGQPFDIAILDFLMPEMDGEQLMRAMRAHAEPAIAHIPAVLLSSSGQRASAQSYAEMGFSGYLGKPVHFHTLKIGRAHV
jgi:CheY-like chemotaxis protein